MNDVTPLNIAEGPGMEEAKKRLKGQPVVWDTVGRDIARTEVLIIRQNELFDTRSN